jgi:hypothetical protein
MSYAKKDNCKAFPGEIARASWAVQLNHLTLLLYRAYSTKERGYHAQQEVTSSKDPQEASLSYDSYVKGCSYLMQELQYTGAFCQL